MLYPDLLRHALRVMRVLWHSTLLMLLTLVTLIPVVHAAEVDNIRTWAAPDHVRVVFDLSDEVKSSLFMLDDPRRLVVDLQDASLAFDPDSVELGDSAIKDLRTGIRHGDDLRVVLDLKRKVVPHHFSLPPAGQYGHRLVVDLDYPGESALDEPIDPIAAMIREQEMSAERALVEAKAQGKSPSEVLARRDREAKPHPKRDIIVAVDPGHGGEDPGAIGPSGTYEKDVVLAIARKLKAKLNNTPGFKAFLTRDGDYYVGLRQRTLLARKQKADFFVSVHADAVKSRGPSGSSVYALSQHGATSETARWLAKTENRSDLIGGVDGRLDLSDKDEVLRGVLLDLTMTATMNESLSTGSQVLDQLEQVNELHKSQVEQAGFVVLKSPDIPSLLVETGFISNPAEEQRLMSSSFQAKLADAIGTGIIAHFRQHPPPSSLLAWQRDQRRGGESDEYRVEAGDTLSEVAARYDVTMLALKQANDLNGNILRVGQVLKIPQS